MSPGIIALGVLGGLVVYMILRAAPRTTVVLWVAVLFFVPIWVGVAVGPFLSAVTIVTLLAMATSSRSIELTAADALMAVLVFLLVGQYALKLTSLPSMFVAMTDWVLPFVWGRLILTRVHSGFLALVLATAATVAGTLAVVEGLTGENPFVGISFGSPTLQAQWGTLQERGGSIRAEGAFGHSIALGATLAMMSAFVLACRWRLWAKLASLIVIVAAITFTLSRIGLVTLVITIALSLIVLPSLSRRAKWFILLAGLIAAVVVVPLLSEIFLSAGREAGGSADYRWDLFALFPLIPWFGSAADFSGLTVDGQYFGNFATSVDNAILVAALRAGLVPAVLLILIIVLAIVPAFRQRSTNAASIAVAGQVPGLFAVAFITQYATIFWFVVGLAVAGEVARRQAGRVSNAPTLGEAVRGTADFSPTGPLIRFRGLASERSSGGEG